MSCYQCRSDFGFLNKSISCSTCKFAFCKRCIKTLPDNKVKICLSCSRLSEKEETSKHIEIPKNLAKLKEKNYADKKISDVDQLEKRLEDLSNKKQEACSTTVEDLELRLKKLRGVSTKSTENQQGKSSILLVKPKSDQEQIDELYRKYKDEAAIASRYDEQHKNDVTELDNRLQNLKRGKHISNHSPIEDFSDINSTQILMRTIVEPTIERKYESFNDAPESDRDELPFCCLCTNDAVWLCIECDRDLYCDKCYKYCHSKSEYGPHQHEAYKRKYAINK